MNYAYNRYFNHVGNVLGTTGYHNTYSGEAATTTDSASNGATSIFLTGYGANGGTYCNFTCIPGSVTAGSCSGSTATITYAGDGTGSTYLLGAVGRTIVVSGVTPSAYNGTKTITAASGYTVSYSQTCTGALTGGGTVNFNLLNDVFAVPSMMRWGNYDTVNAAVRWESGEVPSGLSSYSNSVPGSHALPASFYLASQPSWYGSPYGSTPWPGIGPDVTSGNISGSGGYAYKNPAQLCFENTTRDSSFGSAYTVTNASYSGGYVTYTIGSHSIAAGDAMKITGITPSTFNGAFLVYSTTGTTVTVGMLATPGTYTSGGTVTSPNILAFDAAVCYTGSTPSSSNATRVFGPTRTSGPVRRF